MRIGILYLDDRHLEDLLLVQRLARVLKQLPAPMVLVHGSGGRAEQLLEAEGYVPERRDGVLVVRSAHERGLVERGIRETNQRLVAGLNELLIPAVGIQGSDRGLLRRTATGALRVGRTAWLVQLLRQGVWPVVSTLVATETEQIVEAPAAEVLGALAGGCMSEVVIALLRKELEEPIGKVLKNKRIGFWIGQLEELPEAVKRGVFQGNNALSS